MRGKVRRCRFSSMPDRITPAYAGKRCNGTVPQCVGWDHPRLCGEKIKTFLQSRGAWGSPPPMRGKVLTLVFPAVPSRITPAYAGKRRKDHSGGHDK